MAKNLVILLVLALMSSASTLTAEQRIQRTENMKASFKITELSLQNLRSEGVPDDLLEKLEHIKNQEVIGEEKFVGILNAILGEKQTLEFKSLILKHTNRTMKKLIKGLGDPREDVRINAAIQLSRMGKKLSDSQVNEIIGIMRYGKENWYGDISVKYYAAVALVNMRSQYVSDEIVREAKSVIDKEKPKNRNELRFPPFKAILSPNISVWMPIGGDDSEVYGMSLKYGVELMFKTSDKLLIELGYSYSSLGVKEDYIEDFVENASVEESSGGNVNQFFGGIRVLFPSEGETMPYLRIGASSYKRGDITASYSGRGFEGDITFPKKESGMSIYGGFGIMILKGNNVAFDLQANANLLLLEESKPIWFEPAIALNILDFLDFIGNN